MKLRLRLSQKPDSEVIVVARIVERMPCYKAKQCQAKSKKGLKCHPILD